MNLEVIINPKSNIISGIHKCENYITNYLEKLVSAKITPIDKFKKPYFPARMFYLFLNLISCGSDNRNNNAKNEFLYFSDQQLALLLNFIKTPKKIFVMTYDIFPSIKYYSNKLSLIDKMRYQLVIKALKKADYLITISEMMKQELIRELGFNEEKIHIVYLGVDHSLYKPIENTKELRKKLSLPEKDNIVLCVSSEEPRKNIETLIKAFKELKNKLPNCKLIKIGKSAWRGAREKLLKLISELNLTNDIIFKEGIPEEEMPYFYSISDVFINIPLFEGGWANPVIEAMACGCPVIASMPALEELVNDYGILVNPVDYKLIADNIYNILIDQKKSKLLSEKSKKRAEMFSWEKTAKGIVSIIEKSSST
ncbi:MAG: glycosyltransferase family 4 protein [Armatimonadetes bacterium]|nr:glycosyltransferase family 4 protein [Armatimonadota bacterium]